MARTEFVDSFLDQLADAFIERVMSRLKGNGGAARNGLGNGRRASKLAGRKLNMRCRYPGCKNRSKGPRMHFLCETHLKNPGWPKAKATIEKAEAKS